METHHYRVILEREEEGGYHAFCPTLKGCHSQGDTLEEALVNVREAIEAYLERLQKHGEPAPVEGDGNESYPSLVRNSLGLGNAGMYPCCPTNC